MPIVDSELFRVRLFRSAASKALSPIDVSALLRLREVRGELANALLPIVESELLRVSVSNCALLNASLPIDCSELFRLREVRGAE